MVQVLTGSRYLNCSVNTQFHLRNDLPPDSALMTPLYFNPLQLGDGARSRASKVHSTSDPCESDVCATALEEPRKYFLGKKDVCEY